MPDPLIDRRGVNAVESILLNDFKWAFREQAVIDHGIDAQAEVIEGEKLTGKLIALQIKTGPSYFRRHGSDYIYYGDIRHLDYWLGHALPVVLVLHDPDRGLTLWQEIEREQARITKHGWSIIIPAANILSAAARPAFEAIAANIPTDRPPIRRARMAMDLDLMKLLATKDDVYFEIEHWTSKSLGIRGIAVMFDETEKEPADLELDWMYPVRNHEYLMAWWFPWLGFEHVETRDTMSAEIDIVVLRVWLNDLANGFIAVEDYFANGVPDPAPPDWFGFAAP